MGLGEDEQGFPEQIGNISSSDTGYPDQSYGSAEYSDEEDGGSYPNVMGGTGTPGMPESGNGSGSRTGDPSFQVCMGGHQPNPNYDPDICKQCMSECDIAHPLEPCEGSDLWCNAINANALSERRSCYENTCGWRCAVCI
jgi:hypothetical protein